MASRDRVVAAKAAAFAVVEMVEAAAVVEATAQAASAKVVAAATVPDPLGVVATRAVASMGAVDWVEAVRAKAARALEVKVAAAGVAKATVAPPAAVEVTLAIR